ncbi:hypothetical protein EJ110_NYTH16437 [Nymphaea thermarum]|nr:hypothetical protein EJ110_NYTH16437 [Nymphaea thermarum]
MTFLCFVFDLRSLPLPLLKDLRQSLLQLANLYAISSPSCGSRSQTPGDLIALCYIQRNRSSGIDELEIAYSPRGQFNLRDFHHAVSSLPEDCFLSDLDASKIPEAEDDWLFSGFVKSWLQELKGDIEEPLKATFYFKNTIMDSGNHFSCNLFASAVHMVDGFVPCQTCRCHGLPAGSAADRTSMSCPIANQELASSELSEIGIKVGERTILRLPSFQSYSEPQRVHGHIRFNVIERTSLCSLSEGVILGTSYFAVPCNDAELSSAESGKQNLNTQRREILPKTDPTLLCCHSFFTDICF